MDMKVSTDPKIVKMFRRLERFLDQEGIGDQRSITFQNAETLRPFAVFVSPDTWEELVQMLRDAQDTIDILEDDNALLDLIDAQNDVLMGRVAWDEAAKVADTVDWTFTGNDVVGNAFDFPPDEKCGTFHVEGLDYTEADASPDEDYPEIMIPRREYEELLNLRRKRTQDKKTITELNAKVTQYKRASETFNRQRDSYLAQLLEAKSGLDNLANDLFTWNKLTLNEARQLVGEAPLDGGDVYYNTAAARNEEQEWAFIGGIRGVGFPDLEEFHAFTSDAIRD